MEKSIIADLSIITIKGMPITFNFSELSSGKFAENYIQKNVKLLRFLATTTESSKII